LTWAPMTELRFMIVKDNTTRTIKSVKDKSGETPQASPKISEPKFGRINSALETMPNDFNVWSMILPRKL